MAEKQGSTLDAAEIKRALAFYEARHGAANRRAERIVRAMYEYGVEELQKAINDMRKEIDAETFVLVVALSRIHGQSELEKEYARKRSDNSSKAGTARHGDTNAVKKKIERHYRFWKRRSPHDVPTSFEIKKNTVTAFAEAMVARYGTVETRAVREWCSQWKKMRANPGF